MTSADSAYLTVVKVGFARKDGKQDFLMFAQAFGMDEETRRRVFEPFFTTG